MICLASDVFTGSIGLDTFLSMACAVEIGDPIACDIGGSTGVNVG